MISRKNTRIGLAIAIIISILAGCGPSPEEQTATSTPLPSQTPEEPSIMYELQSNIDPPESGSVLPASGQFEEGETLNLHATPHNGYAFDHWSGDISGDTPETTIIMGANKTVTAHFIRIPMLKQFDLGEKAYLAHHSGNFLMDFDSDGDLDLIFSQIDWPPPQEPQAVLAYQNDGTGNFTKATKEIFADMSVVTTHMRDWAVEDFDRNGRDDLFIADPGNDAQPFPGGQSLILIQNEKGQLIDETQARLPQQLAFTHSVAAGDIDQDGDVDIYMGNINNSTQVGPRFYINDGNGFFSDDTSRIPGEITRLERQFISSLLLDVDQDGDLDLVLGQHGQTSAKDVILLNDGSGMFSYAPEESMPPRLGGSGFATVKIVSADFNKDDWPDLLMATQFLYTDPNMQLLLNNGDGTFRDETFRIEQDWSVYKIPDPEMCGGTSWLSQLFIADANNDTWPDILVQGTDCLHGALLLFSNDEGKRFVVTENYQHLTINGVGPAFLVPGDVDNDGNLDVVLRYPSMTQQVYLRIPSSEKQVIDTSPSPPTPAASTTPPELSLQDEFEFLPVLGVEADKTAIDQMIANTLDDDPLNTCPVVRIVGKAVDAINPAYLVFISAAPGDSFLVVIHTIDADSEPYGSALSGTILEDGNGNVVVVAEYPVPEGEAPPGELNIQVIGSGCEIFEETVSYGKASTSQPASPFVGDWISTDPGDGSNQQLSISESNGNYSVSYADDVAASCGRDEAGNVVAVTGIGLGTVTGNVLGVDLSFYCMTDPQSFLASVPVNYTYDEATDTMDHYGTIWSRP